jgi:hypothetical protein
MHFTNSLCNPWPVYQEMDLTDQLLLVIETSVIVALGGITSVRAGLQFNIS